MNPIHLLLLISLMTLSTVYGQRKKSRKPYAKEIPLEVLHEKGISPYSANYKRGYYYMLPYLHYNEHGKHRGIQGDFYHLLYHKS